MINTAWRLTVLLDCCKSVRWRRRISTHWIFLVCWRQMMRSVWIEWFPLQTEILCRWEIWRFLFCTRQATLWVLNVCWWVGVGSFQVGWWFCCSFFHHLPPMASLTVFTHNAQFTRRGYAFYWKLWTIGFARCGWTTNVSEPSKAEIIGSTDGRLPRSQLWGRLYDDWSWMLEWRFTNIQFRLISIPPQPQLIIFLHCIRRICSIILFTHLCIT